MATINASAQHPPARKNADRCAHRITCILAGGLAVLGSVLGLLVNPWFMGLAVVGGGWLILAPESSDTAASPGRPVQ